MSHLQHNKCVSILNRLANDAKYVKEYGVKMLHLNGTTSSYATTTAVDFGYKSFTIVNWAKLKLPADHSSVIVCKNIDSKLRFTVKNKTNETAIISLA